LDELEKLVKPLIDLVNNLDKKVSLLAQKIVIATVIIGAVFNGIGVWYSANGGKDYSEPEKKTYYEQKISDSEKIKFIEAELARLKSTTPGSAK
jgi:4-hydroxy-3-methylbut-2-en-1-yl diphosphate synthase IspG/GcpE